MHVNLMLLYMFLLYLWIMIQLHKEVKNWTKLLSILPSSRRDHPGLVKYLQSGQPLVDTFYSIPSHLLVQFGW